MINLIQVQQAVWNNLTTIPYTVVVPCLTYTA